MLKWEALVLVACTATVSCIVTAMMQSFVRAIKQRGRLESRVDKAWEKLCVLRRVLEQQGIKIPEKPWDDGPAKEDK